jgi:hypothetical protein
MNVDLRLDGHLVENSWGSAEAGLQAACIATAVNLGPRPQPAAQGLLVLDSDEPLVEDVTSVGADWARAVDALVRAPRRRWQLLVEGAVALDIVDAGDGGLWSVSRVVDGTAWRPVASEELWSALLVALQSQGTGSTTADEMPCFAPTAGVTGCRGQSQGPR